MRFAILGKIQARHCPEFDAKRLQENSKQVGQEDDEE
jgi:hypothetical protein